ncbi:hypothetical protein C2G38_2031728 [Gigaspora rosea]|uniref:Uncharacterized protein n=1 Tax=Gigaspora rosea TaxID=44941 RepID=A0A397VTE1_9GLOM|nr:hypothetical protein C2G38_2031728 [Gigaspora rosea]
MTLINQQTQTEINETETIPTIPDEHQTFTSLSPQNTTLSAHDSEDTRSIRSTSSRPPAYSIEDEPISPPTIPFSAHISLNSTTSIPSLNNSQISLPSYDHAKVDMPPQYPHLKIDVNSPWELVPIEPQQPWPITKKLYIFGFLIWPFWYIGAVYSIFGKDETTKTWGRRCFLNSIVLTSVVIYIVVAYCKAVLY